jgi:hypothetical protein
VDAEDLMVDDGGQRQAVEGEVALLPHVLACVHTEALLALVQEGLLHVVHLPAVHLYKKKHRKNAPDYKHVWQSVQQLTHQPNTLNTTPEQLRTTSEETNVHLWSRGYHAIDQSYGDRGL